MTRGNQRDTDRARAAKRDKVRTPFPSSCLALPDIRVTCLLRRPARVRCGDAVGERARAAWGARWCASSGAGHLGSPEAAQQGTDGHTGPACSRIRRQAPHRCRPPAPLRLPLGEGWHAALGAGQGRRARMRESKGATRVEPGHNRRLRSPRLQLPHAAPPPPPHRRLRRLSSSRRARLQPRGAGAAPRLA
eukprot:100664-Chlamydomonas_euryale.AAC.6